MIEQADQIYDKFLKEMTELHPKDFVWFAFPNEQFKVLSTQLDKELIVRSRQVDLAMIIRTKRGRQIIHPEFKSDYNRKVLRQVFGYAGALTIKYKFDVTSILYLIRPPSKKARNLGLYEARPFDEPTNQFSFRVVKLWQFRDAILRGDKRFRALIPLLAEFFEKPDISVLYHQRELILAQNDFKRQAEAVFYTLAFGQRHFPQKALRSLFKEDQAMYEHWERVPIFGDRIRERFKQGKQEGWKEGREEGLVQALQENIMDALTANFGPVNGKIARLINSVDNPKKLRAIFRHALKAKKLDTVVEMLQIAKPPAKRKMAKV
jgi:hypothetical protein